MPRTVEQLVEEARHRIRNATPDEVAGAVLSGKLVVVDVRESDEFESGHISGAINIPRGWLEFKADRTCPAYDERLERDKPILVYCPFGGRSALATAALKELGYANVMNLAGGLDAWTRSGYPVEQPEAAPVA